MSQRSPDWRIWLGLILTLGWLLLGALYISADVSWAGFIHLPADKLGSFLEGAFAPLAFLWLVIGYFLQQKELEQNTLALRAQAIEIQRSAEQAVIQSEMIAASEVHARQEAFLQIARTVRSQLGSISGFLYISSQASGSGGTVSAEERGRLFAQMTAQEPELFSRRMLELNILLEDPEQRYDLFYGTPIRARHSNNFIFTFERLLRRAAEVDEDGMIVDAMNANAHGFLYNIAKRHQSNAPEELADHNRTGRQILM